MNDDVTLQGILRDPKLVVDTVAPTLLFAVLAALAPLVVAAGAALAWCAVAVLVRRRRKQSLAHAVSGLGGVVIGVAVALLSGDALGFFVPGIVGNLAFGVLPPYWAAKAFWVADAHGTWWPYLLAGVAYNLAVVWLLLRRFIAKNTA